MSTPVRIKGGSAGTEARVTRLGQLVTAPLAYDETVFKELAEPDTAYNFYEPKSGRQFVITGIRAKADRQVSNTDDADVVIYEASSNSTTTVDKVLHQEAMVRGESITLIPMNVLVTAGKFVNAKTTDDDVHMTIMGYYVSVVN
jgi:hypothetical protein